MNTYVIRITTINNLFADYMIEANNIMQAKSKARKAFFRDYPGADKNIKLSLGEPSSEILTEIIKLIRRSI